jgi:arylsulfatase A-like enzyme
MDRRSFLNALGSASAGLALPGAAAQTNPAPRPNILFILADDLGWGDLSCYGNPRTKTPNLDRLAAQGALFSQFYVNGSVCSPTRSAFMTGRFPARNRLHGHLATEEINQRRAMPNFLSPATPNIAGILRQAGYRTGHIGKWHLGHSPDSPRPEAYGFDHQVSTTSSDLKYDEQAPGFRARSTAFFVDQTLDFIRSTPKQQPFYAQLWSLLPHAALAPTPEQLEPFKHQVPGRDVPWPGAQQIYNASLRDLDTQIGRLLDELDKDGRADNTLVLFSSDNGPEDIHINNASHSAFGSPGPFRGRKRSLYEGGVRVPGILRWPGRIKPGRVDTRSVLSAVDWLPTLAQLAGAKPPTSELDGENISDILQVNGRARQKALFWEWRYTVHGYSVNRSPILSMREGDWKLMMNPDRSRVELYNIPQDSMELNNQSAAQSALTSKMAERLLAWQKQLPAGPMEPAAGRNDWNMPQESK